MSDDLYTRCGKPLVQSSQLELQPEIFAESGELKNLEKPNLTD